MRQSIAVTMQPVSAAPWQDIPAIYLVCTQDNGTPPTLQRDQAERAHRAVEISAGTTLSCPSRKPSLTSFST
ncbi:MAG: hypothetical protein ACRDST_12205 [Pseudonocardiaceae bacterium]